jgi:hypothetical protein
VSAAIGTAAAAAIRDLAKRYAEVCASERNRRSRDLWRDHNGLAGTRPLVICSWYFASHCLDEIDAALPAPLAAEYPFTELEKWLRRQLWGSTIPDDRVYDPWYVMSARMQPLPADVWGIPLETVRDRQSRGWRHLPVVRAMEDLERMQATPHAVLDDNTPDIRAVRDLVGDILPVHVKKSTVYPIWRGTDLSAGAGQLLGLEELLYALYEAPQLVHALMRFMQDAVLANLDQGEAAGDWSTVDSQNYGMPPHARELPEPKANAHGARLKDLWFFTHAQEFEGVSPAQHREFLLQYQMPIMERFGLVNYGCCETLDGKIDMLRAIPNLRRILIGPRASMKRGCEQIGRDYVVSWRPSPTIVSSGFDERHVRTVIRRGVEDSRGCHVEIMLKEMMTVEGDLSRLFRWTEIANQEVGAA